MNEKFGKQPVTSKVLKNETRMLRRETLSVREDLSAQLSAVEKKLHVEVIGTQNDLSKFKDEVIHYVLKTQNAVDDFRRYMTLKVDEMFNRMEDHDSRITRLESL